MSPVNLFRKIGNRAQVLEDKPFSSEKELQAFFEANLLDLLGVEFLASEYATGPPLEGRIDTLGIDEQGHPFVIEYKRRSNENIINQGLFYLAWLESNEAEFRALVRAKLGPRRAQHINFDNAGLLCVAWEFSNWDMAAVANSRSYIELIEYRRFGEDLFALETIFSSAEIEEAMAPEPTSVADDEGAADHEAGMLEEVSPPIGPLPDFSMTSGWRRASATLRSLFMQLHDYVISMGPEVQVLPGKNRIAFKGNFFIVAVYVRSRSDELHAYVSVDPANVKLERGFTRDTQGYPLNHNRLEITIRSRSDLERAKPLLRKAYEHDVSGERFRWVGWTLNVTDALKSAAETGTIDEQTAPVSYC